MSSEGGQRPAERRLACSLQPRALILLGGWVLGSVRQASLPISALECRVPQADPIWRAVGN